MSITWAYNANPEGTNWGAGRGPGCIWVSELSLYVAVGSGATHNILTSPDGTTWTARTTSENNSFNGIAWSPTLSLLVAVCGSGTHRVFTSPDGITWTARNASAASNWQSVAWSPSLGLFVAVALTGTTGVMTSSDGITWSSGTIPSKLYNKVIWAAGLGLFLAFTGVGTTAGISTSSDGSTWTDNSPTLNSSETIGHICWSSTLSLLVMVTVRSGTFTDRVWTSTTGTSWTQGSGIPDNGTGWVGVCWSTSQSLFIAVAELSSGNAMTSSDGFTWTSDSDIEANLFPIFSVVSDTIPNAVVFGESFANGDIAVGTFGPPPVLTITLSPDNGPADGGTVVDITSNINYFTAATRVFFGDVEATNVDYINQKHVQATTPRNLPATYTVTIKI